VSFRTLLITHCPTAPIFWISELCSPVCIGRVMVWNYTLHIDNEGVKKWEWLTLSIYPLYWLAKSILMRSLR
jgi:hypothetical protein